MIPEVLKEFLVPGGLGFLLWSLAAGTLLLYRHKDNGRAGRRLLSGLLVFYWVVSTPVLAVPFIKLLSPGYPPVKSAVDARGATAIVVLGAGMEVFHSRDDVFEVSTREDALRMMETARVYRALDAPWVIVTGGHGTSRHTEAVRMAEELRALGVPAGRIVVEPRARNTRDHGLFVPPLLRERHVTRFVLVTSRQHIWRALRVFRKVGWDPVPSSPEPYVDDFYALDHFLPSRQALLASEAMIYDLGAVVYYRLRGWI